MKLTNKQERALESIKDTLTDSERYLKCLFYECEGLTNKLHKIGIDKRTILEAEVLKDSLDIIEGCLDEIKSNIEEFINK